MAEEADYICLLRGLPFNCTEEMVHQFLDAEGGIAQLEMTKNPNGKPSGEAYVKLENEQAFDKILTKHKETMEGTTRWIEVIKTTKEQFESKALSRSNEFGHLTWDGCIKFNGISEITTKNQMEQFLDGCVWHENALFFPSSEDETSTGEAWIQFANFASANKALEMNNVDFNGNTIQVSKSSNAEIRAAIIENTKRLYLKDNPNGIIPVVEDNSKKWGGLNLGGGGPMRQKMQAQRPGPYAKVNSSANSGPVDGWNSQKPEASNGSETPAPAAVQPAAAQFANEGPPPGSPYKHIISLAGASPDVTVPEVQAFFRPSKAIAVNIKAAGNIDVAFKTHEIALQAMEKNSDTLKDVICNFTLRSLAQAAKEEAFYG